MEVVKEGRPLALGSPRHISKLRKVLGNRVLVTQGRGYLLQTEPGQLDLDCFESMLAAGPRASQEGDPPTAACGCETRLGCGAADVRRFRVRLVRAIGNRRLDEAQRAALEELIDAELTLGEHARLVSELAGLVHQNRRPGSLLPLGRGWSCTQCNLPSKYSRNLCKAT